MTKWLVLAKVESAYFYLVEPQENLPEMTTQKEMFVLIYLIAFQTLSEEVNIYDWSDTACDHLIQPRQLFKHLSFKKCLEK